MPDIPFTQYLMPNGRKSAVTIDRPDDVASIARKIIDRGYRFECEVLSTGHASFTVVGPNDDGDDDDLDIAIAMDGPQVPNTVDKLIKRFAAKIGVSA